MSRFYRSISPNALDNGLTPKTRWLLSAGVRMGTINGDTGRDHEPTRIGLECASGLLPVDHPNMWASRDLVKRAVWQHEHRAVQRAAARSMASQGYTVRCRGATYGPRD
jgi:hypothetical protein